MTYIKKHNAVSDPAYYNLTEGGTGGDTLKFLSQTQLAERSQKIKERLAALDCEVWSIIQSEKMKKVRRNPAVEAKRIESFKATYKKKTKQQIREQYTSRSGGNAYQAKPVETPAGLFACAKDAANHHNVHTQTVLNRCKNINFKDWKFK